MALARACTTDSVYIAKNKSINTSVLLYTEGRRVKTKALLDSGATECFRHPKWVDNHELPKEPLKRPRKVQNVDGTTNCMGEITHTVTMAVCHQSRMKIHQFLVADIGEDNLILGYPFFKAANPFIDWQKGSTNGNVILTTCDEWV